MRAPPFAASRAQLVRENLFPRRGCDRHLGPFSRLNNVYQGVARMIPAKIVEVINRFATGPRLPDITFLLDMDAIEAHKRISSRRTGDPDRMEEQPAEFTKPCAVAIWMLSELSRQIRLLMRPNRKRTGPETLRFHAIFKGSSA